MTKREVIKAVISGKKPPYVPWSFGFTMEAHEKLVEHYKTGDLDPILQNHLAWAGRGRDFENLGNGRVRDIFGVVWNRSVDKDIGVIEGLVIPEPDLKNVKMPDPLDKRHYETIDATIKKHSDCFRVFPIGFSLYERAWTMRGMENLMMDFYDNPDFVRELFNMIADFNVAQVKKSLEYDFDAVYFGDDWGQQHGLQMGPAVWREFIKPVLKRMYGAVRSAGRYVFIHSCGDVDELFDDLVEIGLNCFNPFQPEVMDVWSLLPKYRGRLAFHGGLSTQKTLPFGKVDDVRQETRKLIKLGSDGGYILSPAHAVEGDVPVENMLAFIEEVQSQKGYKA